MATGDSSSDKPKKDDYFGKKLESWREEAKNVRKIDPSAAAMNLNQRHRFMDYCTGSMCYLASAGLHITGQSTGFTFFSLWVAGTYMMFTAEERRVFRIAVDAKEKTVEGSKGALYEFAKQEATGTWLWTLASINQFRVSKTFYWTGASVYAGLISALYYSARLGQEFSANTL